MITLVSNECTIKKGEILVDSVRRKCDATQKSTQQEKSRAGTYTSHDHALHPRDKRNGVSKHSEQHAVQSLMV